ncbi:MAG: hypothetical protein R2774_04150 [Saprospiraceae bacterium]
MKLYDIYIKRFVSLYLIFLISFISYNSVGQASISLKIDSTDVLIGDKIKAHIAVKNASPKMTLDWKNLMNIVNQDYLSDTTRFEKIADVAILDYGQWQSTDDDSKFTIPSNEISNGVAQNTISFAIYNEGTFHIQPPKIITDTIQITTSPSQIIRVHLPKTIENAADTIQINPIKDIIKTKPNFSDYLPYILGILAAITLGLLIWYFIRKRRKISTNQQEILIETIATPPYEQALQSLQELEQKRLWQNGQVKAYQTELTDIIRKYIEGNFGVKAQEMTTIDILDALDPSVFDTNIKSTLSDILNMADMVKFAKAAPESNVHHMFMQSAYQWVKDTNARIVPSQKDILEP